MSGPTLLESVDAARASRTLQRVLLSGAEGLGRSHTLNGLTAMPLLRVEVAHGRLVSQTLRALIGEAIDDDASWNAIRSAAPLANLEPERATVAAELLASLLGIRRADFRTAKLDEDSRREGAFLELARWLSERAHAEGLVLAFDDAHLADDDGAAFLEVLSQREEPVPMVLLVSHDADVERFTRAFRARREAWLSATNWSRLELAAPGVTAVQVLLTTAGAPAELIAPLAAHAQGNPGLALGLWAYARGLEKLEVAQLPRTLDGLRLSRVRALGDDVLRACATLAALGGVAPLAALSTISPELPLQLQPALASGVVRMVREGALELCRLVDPRMAHSLNSVLPSVQVLGAKLAVGAWAAQALEQLDFTGFTRSADVLVPLATPALDGVTSSHWYEALAMTKPGRPDAVAWLEQAVRSAQGVRRLVLLRRIAEVKLFLGLPDEAIGVVVSAGRPVPAAPQPLPPSAAGRVLGAQTRGVLDRWEVLSIDEAMAALDVVRAESISYLVKKEDTQKAFTDLQKRLPKLKGAAVPHLWIRWAKGWSWFLCEILGRSQEAMAACALVRRNVSEAQLAADEDAIAFVRAEEVATCSVGQFARAMTLTLEHIALAERAGKLRDACLGWNAHAIVHYGQGSLALARKAFERSLELARSTGWLRREAITLHNLSLVLAELGELDAAFAAETTYARLSVLVGNHAGKAEAPLVLASVELARGRLIEAEAQLGAARKAAEANGWDMLMTWSRALTGRLRLLRAKAGGDALEVTKAKNDLMAAIEVLEERSVGWTEELDPGEVVALYALALKWSGQGAAAGVVIERTLARLPVENVVSRQQLAVASAVVAGQGVDEALKWFEVHGFERRVAMWRGLTSERSEG
jgi:tetratricopeptide (TPR) repeat protein